jgi:hypothetical protein
MTILILMLLLVTVVPAALTLSLPARWLLLWLPSLLLAILSLFDALQGAIAPAP